VVDNKFIASQLVADRERPIAPRSIAEGFTQAAISDLEEEVPISHEVVIDRATRESPFLPNFQLLDLPIPAQAKNGMNIRTGCSSVAG
jgi:hypothetical protein